ncbi:Acetolactate synthase, mitochondrial [Orbilia blumenaviensis]|uniref:Acetolactate synthase n=1 Tax=Orbilia blumenaviensis TaxID=1796055 RepID=A0AAV9U051_9PEZI
MASRHIVNLVQRHSLVRKTAACTPYTTNSTAIFTSKANLKPPKKQNQLRKQSTATAAVISTPLGFVSFPEPSITRPSSILPAQVPYIEPPNITAPHVEPDQKPLNLIEDSRLVGMTGGQIIVDMVLRHDVKHIFSFPGGAILPIMDALYQCEGVEVILPRHEQCAGHMAEGYSRASGKPGVVLVTSGPGATNIITPLQDALSDGIPLVVICGQVSTTVMGTDSFQEADIIGISKPCTKWNYQIKNIRELPRRINEAFEIAMSGRPGPVLLDIPKDVAASILKQPVPTQATVPKIERLPTKNSISIKNVLHHNLLQQIALQKREDLRAAIQRSAGLINIAKKPIIYAGQGILAKPEGPILLRELAEKAQIPVTTTLQGLGCFDELDDKSLHMLGMHGTAYANAAIQEADLVIALGARFDDRATGVAEKFAPAAKKAASEKIGGIIHFEIQPKNINKVVHVTEAVVGDVSTNLALLLPLVDEVSSRPIWMGRIMELKQRFPISHFDRAPASGLINPQVVVEELSRLVESYKDNVIITTGVGQHQMWAAQHYRWRYPRTIITSGGLGTMGFGLPSAIGAKLSQPEKVVIDIDGDASFQMTLMELKTAALYNIGVKIIVMNNDEQGMVSQWQSMFYQNRFMLNQQGNPDFVKVAEGMGIKAIRVSRPDQLKTGLKTLLEYDGPILLDIVTDNKVDLLPMVPAGKALDECVVYQEGLHRYGNLDLRSQSLRSGLDGHQ